MARSEINRLTASRTGIGLTPIGGGDAAQTQDISGREFSANQSVAQVVIYPLLQTDRRPDVGSL